MTTLRWLGFALAVVLQAIPVSHAQDLSVVGAWSLVSFAREDSMSGETTHPWGDHPLGFLMYLPGGHMSAVLTAEGRKPAFPTNEKQAAQLFWNMSSYAGTYTVEGNTVVHHVEAAWLPGWVGGDQPRKAVLEGDRLTIRTQPIRDTFAGKDYVYVLVWKRAE